jgi:hypothetical protein
MVQQLFDTLEFDNRDNLGFTWMTNDVRKFSNFTRFGQLLGYEFDGLETPNGHRLHLDTSEYSKNKMTPLYALGGKPGDTSNLLPIYDILLRMFRANISPSGGNNDAIIGGLVHLLHHAYVVYEEGEFCEEKEIDVLHFIFFEMHLAMIDKKIPPYAPYILKLILDKDDEEEREEEEEIQFANIQEHKLIKLYKKTAHLMTSAQDTFSPSGYMDDNRYTSGSRRKNADPPSGQMVHEFKKLKWWQRALFCMNSHVRQTQYKDYVEHKRVRAKQRDLDARLKIVENCKGASTQDEDPEQANSEFTLSFGKWNKRSSFDWKELADVTSKGKEALNEDLSDNEGSSEASGDDDVDEYDE